MDAGGLAALPLALVQRVLLFVGSARTDRRVFSLQAVPHGPSLPHDLMGCLARVHSSWARAMQDVRDDFAQSVCSLTLDAHVESDGKQMYVKVAHRGSRLRSLAVRASTATRYDLEIDWDGMLALCPKLERLDLANISWANKHTVQVLRAASVHCPHIIALLLPEGDVSADAVSKYKVLEAFDGALKQWSVHGTGLRLLRIPPLPSYARHPFEWFEDYASAVPRYTPSLEYFQVAAYADPFDADYSDGALPSTDQRCFQELDAWEHFAGAVSMLKEIRFLFDASDEFFECFRAGSFPHLRSFSVAGDFLKARAGACLHQVPKACPSLTYVRIISRRITTNWDVQRPVGVDDALLAALAACCPSLSRLVIKEALFEREVFWSRTITNRGVCALSALPALVYVRLNTTQCTEQGVFALLQNAPSSGVTRVVELFFGLRKLMRFPMLVLKTLILLYESLHNLSGRRFVAKLYDCEDHSQWVEAELLRLVQVVTALQRRSPDVQVDVYDHIRQPIQLIDVPSTNGGVGAIEIRFRHHQRVEFHHWELLDTSP